MDVILQIKLTGCLTYNVFLGDFKDLNKVKLDRKVVYLDSIGVLL